MHDPFSILTWYSEDSFLLDSNPGVGNGDLHCEKLIQIEIINGVYFPYRWLTMAIIHCEDAMVALYLPALAHIPLCVPLQRVDRGESIHISPHLGRSFSPLPHIFFHPFLFLFSFYIFLIGFSLSTFRRIYRKLRSLETDLIQLWSSSFSMRVSSSFPILYRENISQFSTINDGCYLDEIWIFSFISPLKVTVFSVESSRENKTLWKDFAPQHPVTTLLPIHDRMILYFSF